MKNTRLPFAFVLLIATSMQSQATGYFKDNFSWGYDSGIWTARNGSNGSPFGCAFNPGMVSPSAEGITLLLDNGACSELQTTDSYSYGRIQGALKTGNTAGTVSSIFTYTSWWDQPGRAWQEIDIEFLPTRGNVVHTNVIYQAVNGAYHSWEADIGLGQFGLNVQENVLTIGFQWTADKIEWYVYDENGTEQIIRTLHKDNNDGYISADEIPAHAWPTDDARIMINQWHGDNSSSGLYFPGQYYQQASWAYYDFIEYIPL